MAAQYTPDEFVNKIHKEVACLGYKRGFPGVEFQTDPENDSVLVIKFDELSWHQNKRKSYTRTCKNLTQKCFEDVREEIKAWYLDRKKINHMLSVWDFLYGNKDGVYRPYMIQSLFIKTLESKGLSFHDFTDYIRRISLCDVDKDMSIQEKSNKVEKLYSTFRRSSSRNFREWAWRHPNVVLNSFPIREELQFLLSDGSETSALFNISENIQLSIGYTNTLRIYDTMIPESIMISAKGRPVTDIIGHDAFDVPGLKVTSMRLVSKKKNMILLTTNSVKEDANLRLRQQSPALRMAA